MISPGRAVVVGIAATLVAAGACADSGTDDDGVADAGDAGASHASDAGSVADADADANPCSSAGLCIAPVAIDPTVTLRSVWGSSASDVYAVGSAGTIVHYDGTAWETSVPIEPDGSAYFPLRSVWLAHPGDVWIADGLRIRHGTGWMGPTATTWSFYDDNQGGGGAGFVAGSTEAVWFGRSQPADLKALEWCTGWTGASPIGLQGLALPQPGYGVTVLTVPSPDELWAISDYTNNAVLRVRRSPSDGGAADPSSWVVDTFSARTTTPLRGIFATTTSVWTVGEGGSIRRLATADASPAETFDLVSSPVTAPLNGIFGFADDDVWAVGDQSTVLHWDGTTWTKLETPFDGAAAGDRPALSAVWGSSPTDVWAVGTGAILHFQKEAP